LGSRSNSPQCQDQNLREILDGSNEHSTRKILTCDMVS